MSLGLISLGLAGTVIAGVKPESSPNVGAYSARSTVLNENNPRITTQYSGSITETFDFKEFRFGCFLLTGQAIVSKPVSCDVRVQGYYASKAIANQKFTFKAGPLDLVKDMVVAKLVHKFKGVDTVTFSTAYDGMPVAGGIAGATLVDSLFYKTYNAKAKIEKESHGKAAPEEF